MLSLSEILNESIFIPIVISIIGNRVKMYFLLICLHLILPLITRCGSKCDLLNNEKPRLLLKCSLMSFDHREKYLLC